MARTVGDYTLGVQLGRGSFAVVWQGQHRVSGATVAVKEINTNLLNAKLKQSLECEISILKRVEHRNIVRLKETLEVSNSPLPLLPVGGSSVHVSGSRRSHLVAAPCPGLSSPRGTLLAVVPTGSADLRGPHGPDL